MQNCGCGRCSAGGKRRAGAGLAGSDTWVHMRLRRRGPACVEEELEEEALGRTAGAVSFSVEAGSQVRAMVLRSGTPRLKWNLHL